MTSDALRAKALALPAEERARLAGDLLESLDDARDEGLTPEQWEAAWADEIRKRADDLRAGRARSYPADDVIAELQARRGQGWLSRVR